VDVPNRLAGPDEDMAQFQGNPLQMRLEPGEVVGVMAASRRLRIVDCEEETCSAPDWGKSLRPMNEAWSPSRLRPNEPQAMIGIWHGPRRM
jgi:hypothetical protein